MIDPTERIDAWTASYFKRRLKRLDQIAEIVQQDEDDFHERGVSSYSPNGIHLMLVQQERVEAVKRLYDLGQIEVKP
jgi:hypothetical protein